MGRSNDWCWGGSPRSSESHRACVGTLEDKVNTTILGKCHLCCCELCLAPTQPCIAVSLHQPGPGPPGGVKDSPIIRVGDGAKVSQISMGHGMLSSHWVHSHLNRVRVLIWRKKEDNMEWQSTTLLPGPTVAASAEEGSLEITTQIALQEKRQEAETEESMGFQAKIRARAKSCLGGPLCNSRGSGT